VDYIDFPGTTRTLAAPPNWDNAIGSCGALPIMDTTISGQPFMVSSWTLTPEEQQQLASGEGILFLFVAGSDHPAVGMRVSSVKSKD